MASLFGLYPFLLKLYADGGYQGAVFQDGLRRALRQVNVEIVKARVDAAKAPWRNGGKPPVDLLPSRSVPPKPSFSRANPVYRNC